MAANQQILKATIAALIVLAAAIGSFIFSVLTGRPVILGAEEVIVNPIGIEVPSGPPSVPFPTSGPPQ